MAAADFLITFRYTNLAEVEAWAAEHNDRPEGWVDPARVQAPCGPVLSPFRYYPDPAPLIPTFEATCPRCYSTPCGCFTAPMWRNVS